MGNSKRTGTAVNARESRKLSAVSLADFQNENTALRDYGNRIDVGELSMILHGKRVVIQNAAYLQDVVGSQWPLVDGRSLNFLKIFIAQSVYTVCTRINYKIVPVTNLYKYLHYGTSGTEQYVYKYRCK